LPFGGLVKSRVPPAPLHGGWGEGPQRPISRWSMSKVWVVEPGRTNTAALTADVLVELTEAIVRIEQIGRTVDLDRRLVGSARSGVAAHAHDGCVRKEQGRGVVKARIRSGAR
jgi:hypothetical protein